MAQQTINNTNTNPDSLKSASTKINENFTELYSNKVSTSTTVNGHSLASNVTIVASDVGLGNVDNTSDLNKPISTATQNALNAKVSYINWHMGATGTNSATRYAYGNTINTTELGIPVPACTIKNLRVWIVGNAGITDHKVYIRKNASNTAVMVTGTASAGGTLTSDLVNTASFAAGDILSVSFVLGANGSYSGTCSVSFEMLT